MIFGWWKGGYRAYFVIHDVMKKPNNLQISLRDNSKSDIQVQQME